MCTILSENPETEGCRRGGTVMSDLTMWDFNKAECRTRCRKLVKNSQLLCADLITKQLCWRSTKSKHGRFYSWHCICEVYETQVRRGRHFSSDTVSHSADSRDQPTMADFMNRFPDTFRTVTDNCLFGPKNPGKGTMKR